MNQDVISIIIEFCCDDTLELIYSANCASILEPTLSQQHLYIPELMGRAFYSLFARVTTLDENAHLANCVSLNKRNILRELPDIDEAIEAFIESPKLAKILKSSISDDHDSYSVLERFISLDYFKRNRTILFDLVRKLVDVRYNRAFVVFASVFALTANKEKRALSTFFQEIGSPQITTQTFSIVAIMAHLFAGPATLKAELPAKWEKTYERDIALAMRVSKFLNR